MLPFCGRSWDSRTKKWFVCKECPGWLGSSKNANSRFDSTQTEWGPHHHVEGAVDWCSKELFVSIFDDDFFVLWRSASPDFCNRLTDRQTATTVLAGRMLRTSGINAKHFKRHVEA